MWNGIATALLYETEIFKSKLRRSLRRRRFPSLRAFRPCRRRRRELQARCKEIRQSRPLPSCQAWLKLCRRVLPLRQRLPLDLRRFRLWLRQELKAYKNYEDGKKNNDVEYLLLSLTDDFPEKQEITKEWSFANYRRLSEVIRELISGKYSSKLDAYQKSIFRDYCTFIDCLHQIQSEWRINEFTPYRIESDDYKELRINDLKEKIRFSKMCVMLGAIIEQELKKTVDYNTERAHIFGDNNKDNIGQIFINSGMTRSQGLLEIKILVKSAVALVIQIQGNQYRHCIEFALSKSYKDDKKNWEKYSVDQSTGWYIRSHIDKNQAPFIAFKNSKLPLEIRPCPSRKGKGDGYNKYGNEFLYQSIIIPEGTLVGEIFNMVIYDCKRIFEHIS